MRVLKFGGTSVANPERISMLKDILLKQFIRKRIKIAVVVSAFSGITDKLIEAASLAANGKVKYRTVLNEIELKHSSALADLIKSPKKTDRNYLAALHEELEQVLNGIFLLKEASPRSMDLVQSFGERNSAFIISAYLSTNKIAASFVDAREIITTDKQFGGAQVNFKKTYKEVKDKIKAIKGTPIITGFVASTEDGLTTTLGRGGSDYTASIVAAALDAKALEIWTDVDGVMTCDPRKVKKAFTIDEMSYEEAMEMSHFGAKVIYAPTIAPVMNKRIPIYIKNSFNPGFQGTKIHHKPSIKKDAGPLKGISSLPGIALVSLQGSGLQGVPGIAARMFQSLSRKQINVIMITQASSEQSISIGVSSKDITKAKKALSSEFEYEIKRKQVDPIQIEDQHSLVAIVGDNMQHSPGVAGRLFRALGKNGINVEAIAQGSSERNITFAIKSEDSEKALNAVHDAYFLKQAKTVHIFITGIGLIGGTLLKQIQDNQLRIKEQLGIELKLVGISNTKKRLLNSKGISFKSAKSTLTKSKSKANAALFVKEMIALNLPNSIFVDNTASKEIPKFYKEILSSNISVATPNKVATSSTMKEYLELKKISQNRNVQFRYETNVGAGLPVISTINELISSGDQIKKIEAVLSGSVSYIFNNFNTNRLFHEVVQEAMKLGLTEPDPREDLSGADVKRKITILAREAGFHIEPKEVKVLSILPKAAIKANSVSAFLKILEKNKSAFSEMVSKSESKNERLRFIASYYKGKAVIGLQSVKSDNPFYALQGSDNMIVIHSNRYNKTPLVVRGPGAGAEVTAAGVLSEIIAIGTKK